MSLKRRNLDNIEVENMNTRDIALLSFDRWMGHEKICAKRWGIIMKLMWGVLGGIGFLVLNQINNVLTHATHTLGWN